MTQPPMPDPSRPGSTPPTGSDAPAPLFTRARYRPLRRRPDAVDLPPLDPDNPYDLDEDGNPVYDEYDDDPDEDGPPRRFWTGNRLLMLILALIILITLLAYDLQGIYVPPPPTDTPSITDPLV